MQVLGYTYEENTVLMTREGKEFVYYIENRQSIHLFNAPQLDDTKTYNLSYGLSREHTGNAIDNKTVHPRDIMELGS